MLAQTAFKSIITFFAVILFVNNWFCIKFDRRLQRQLKWLWQLHLEKRLHICLKRKN